MLYFSVEHYRVEHYSIAKIGAVLKTVKNQ